MINHRAHYKLEVDVALRNQLNPVILPRGKHLTWNVIEQCFHDGISVEECVRRINNTTPEEK